MKYSIVLLCASIIATSLANAVEPFRRNTALEEKLATAKAEYYKYYDRSDAHFKFAGILYDAGLMESAFFNTESTLRTFAGTECRELFDRHTRRKLPQLLSPDTAASSVQLTPAQRDQLFQNELKQKAAASPAAAAYLRFAGDPEKWNSRKVQDIKFIREKIALAGKNKDISNLLEYNSAAANFLYLAAKDYEEALPHFIKLYFHDPEYRTMLQAPCGFTISRMIQRLTPSRRAAAEVISRRDPVKLIIDNMHTSPRTVEAYLHNNRKKFTPEKFTKLYNL